jgi:hypothetical protein
MSDKQNKENTGLETGALTENELEDVSGGFTIIDTCQHSWVEMTCNAIWGQCPNLKLTPSEGNYYLASCNKGYFSNERYSMTSI